MMQIKEKQNLIDSYDLWWHSIDFGDGVVSNGPKTRQIIEHELNMWGITPTLVSGKRVLDIGAWDGVYSFEAERRGASEVVAIDGFQWDERKSGCPARWASKRGFDIAKEVLNSKVKGVVLDVMDISVDNVGMFDVIFYFGVLYHLDDPMKSLRKIYKILNSGGKLLIETQAKEWAGMNSKPIMTFHPKNSLNNDITNMWTPNTLCLIKMVEEMDLRVTKVSNIIAGRLFLECEK